MSSAFSPGLFVTGTDTGVGKTLISCTLVSALRAQQVDAVGFKPVASGSVDGRWEDAEHLHAASGRCEPLESLCPLRFHPPLAPTLAARHDGREIELRRSRAALAELRARHATVIVEGVGGLLVPLDERTLVLDFAREAGFPVVIVCRAALGTMNHTLLTLRELRRANLPVAGVVMNVTRPEDTAVADETRAEIERIAGMKLAAIVPFIPQDLPPERRWVLAANAIDRQTSVRALLSIA